MKCQGFESYDGRVRRSLFGACAAGMAVLFVMAGCATTSREVTKDSPPEVKRTVVRERADARWQAILKGDFAGAYGYMSPASRLQINQATFEKRMRDAQFRGSTLGAVECQGETCRVDATMTYDHQMMKGVTTPVQETWIIDGGQAWYVWPQ
jgi:hypothetical protein